MKKLTKRKGFNFLRSYFDVLNEIPDEDDQLHYLKAIINKQFLDEDPKDLSFIANLSYESQRHQIEKSVKGFKDKTKTDLLGNPLLEGGQDPTQGGGKGCLKGPLVQEEEQVQVQEEEQEKVKSKKPKVFSLDVEDCYYNLLQFFNDSEHPDTDKIIEGWKDTIDKLNRIDGLTFQDITHLVHLIKSDDFWSSNFQSVNKLRKKNKEGIIYWKYFYNKFKNNNKKTVNYEQLAEIRRQHPDA